MKQKKWIWTTGGILLVVLLLGLALQWLAPSFSAQTLTEEEANKVALEKYPGDIITTTKTKEEYQIKMQLKTGTYFIKIDARNGDILSLEQLEKAEEPVKETEQELSQKEIEKQLASQGVLQSIKKIQDNNSSYYEVIVNKDDEQFTLKVDPYTAKIIESVKMPTQPITTEKEPSDNKPVTENKLITEQEAMVIAANHLNGTADNEPEFHHNPGHPPYYLVEVETTNGEDDREAIVKIDAYTGTVKSVSWED